jgi:prevent-host-death family protein
MDISVSRFKQACLEVVRRVETTGQPVTITRRGKVVARLSPASGGRAAPALAPWARIRARNTAVCRFEAGESVVQECEFEAAR